MKLGCWICKRIKLHPRFLDLISNLPTNHIREKQNCKNRLFQLNSSSQSKAMGKSDDSIQRRKNKKSRKKQDDKLSNRIAGIIAAKKRRQSGKRRMCEGMCYSLPTPEDPFNERHGKVDLVKKKKKKKQNQSKKGKNPVKKTSLPQDSDKLKEEFHMHAPSKFLILCLKNIQDGLQQDGAFNDGEKPFFVHTWGFEFWKYFTRGKDIIGTNQAHATTEQIAWVAATTADAISRKEKEGLSISHPFLLFLVPSQEKAVKVRKICKPLKALGIHTVSLHPGASIDHQIQGLKNCEPEFLISTPERLQELLSCGAIETSDVSFLVIDGPLTEAGYVDAVESIAKSISGKPQILAFSDCSNSSSNFLMKKSFGESICRIPLDDPINGHSKALDVCASKLSKTNDACC